MPDDPSADDATAAAGHPPLGPDEQALLAAFDRHYLRLMSAE